MRSLIVHVLLERGCNAERSKAVGKCELPLCAAQLINRSLIWPDLAFKRDAKARLTLLFTTKPRGIGLGLVVVKKLTQANGGKIAVQSEVGQGTTFTVTLPTVDKGDV